jgi:hypothetical protein
MEPARETFNPWTVVNVVFHHLAAAGLHPILGGADPGRPAAELLRALGVEPAAEGDRQIRENVKSHLAELRAAVFDEDDAAEHSTPRNKA